MLHEVKDQCLQDMILKNNFSLKTRFLYLYEYGCFDCLRSDKGLELHHIKGRISSSPLNSFLICKECHAHCGHSQKEEAKYLQTTLRWLLRKQYTLTRDDLDFYLLHKVLYNYNNEYPNGHT